MTKTQPTVIPAQAGIQEQPPQHIAIIMDGNRRWARQHKLQAIQGHEYVANKILEPLVEHCIQKQIPYLTLWAFSTENWQRDQEEVQGLMNLFRNAFARSIQKLHEKGVRLNMIGDLSHFPADIQKNVAEWMEKSKNNKKITVTFALNYGGRDEIIRAVRKIVIPVPVVISASIVIPAKGNTGLLFS